MFTSRPTRSRAGMLVTFLLTAWSAIATAAQPAVVRFNIPAQRAIANPQS